MAGLRVTGVAAVAGIGAVPGQIGASIAVARPGLQAGIGIVDLPVSSGPQRTGRHSIVRMAPWTAGPEVTVISPAASAPMVTIVVMAAVALVLVLMPTVMDSAAVIVAIVAMTTPSALHPGADLLMGAFA